MLREVANVSQLTGEGPRRCFSDARMHLVVWYEENGSIHGFELTYESHAGPRAVRWQPGVGLSHSYVRDDETHRFLNASATLVPCHEPISLGVSEGFNSAAEELPARERDFVRAKLTGKISA